MAMTLAVQLLIIVVTTAGIWAGSYFLEESSAKLSAHYSLPPVVQGGIVAAAGSSFPELASVVFAALAGSFDLGVGAVVGSALFNILVIPGLSVVLSPGHMESDRTLVHKDTLFYVAAVLALFLTFAVAVIYYPTGVELRGRLSRPLMLAPLGMYGLYLFLQWQDTREYTGDFEFDYVRIGRQWAYMIVGLALILVSVHQLVEAVLVVGDIAGTSDFLWGVIVVAAATSLPDALVSIQAAGKHRDIASISNVVGSNTFDLLVVIPVGVLLTGSATVNFALAAPLMGCLLLATFLLFVTLRTELVLSRREAYLLLATYGVFMAWVLAEATRVLTVLPD